MRQRHAAIFGLNLSPALPSMLNTPIEYVKGVGPQRAELLRTELGIHTLGQLVEYYPFRYEDRSKVTRIEDLQPEMEGEAVQIAGTLGEPDLVGGGRQERLVLDLYQGPYSIELLWFQGIKWVKPRLASLRQVLVYGRLQFFNGRFSIVHPEVEAFSADTMSNRGLLPVYGTTEKMKARRLDSKALAKIIQQALPFALPHIVEDLPAELLKAEQLIPKATAMQAIHQPIDEALLEQATHRLKFSELFRIQLTLCVNKIENEKEVPGIVFQKGELVTRFVQEVLPFELTEAQRRVLNEIWADTHGGRHMNRLLQGDVGSGKTAVAFIAMLMAVESGYQACIMAPTEILAEQHNATLSVWAQKLGLRLEKLTGSVPARVRKPLHEGLQNSDVHMLVGTHALVEDTVLFKNLGLCIIDEQHRFGVSQRAKLRDKGPAGYLPHILIMTATPIPRTLSLTLYGDLDVSVIDQLPAGRKKIVTVHRYDKDRLKLNEFIRQEIHQGRQVYMVYPLIEESEKLDARALEEGLEAVQKQFPEFAVGVVHGRMKWAEREPVMQSFLRNEIQILVATTVIEVGINVPNATIMVIENAERFGLSQLHQLRGRVGRGGSQSYCILLTKNNLTQEGRQRIQAMVTHADGFVLSELDLKLRGAGDMMGTQQSGQMNLHLADLARDQEIVASAHERAEQIVRQAGPHPRAVLQLPWAKALMERHVYAAGFHRVG